MATTKSSNCDAGFKYAAFLRGINVGGHHKIKMTELARRFEEMGHRNVRTIIASGNVLFDSSESDQAKLTASIERDLEEAVGYEIRVMLRSVAWLRELVELDPFAGYDDIEGHRYVTFFPEPIHTRLELPIHDRDNCYSLLAVRERELFAISSPMPDGRHGDHTKFAAKEFGKVSTTRNWNTVVKMALS